VFDLGASLTDPIQSILFALFGGLTAIVTAVIGPTYDNLLVPELQPAALFPPLSGAGAGGGFLGNAASFSIFTLVNVVDPAIGLLALGVAVAYLSKALVARWAALFDGLLVRLVIAVVAANFTVPIASAVLAVAGGLYPVLAGWDGGTWQHWVNLAGFGQVSFSWDNGALAFVLSLVEFALVLALVLAIGFRDALLAVLVVLLPIFTLLWPLRPFAAIARRAWLLFLELAFLPCVLVVPLELAVGSPSAVLLVAYLGVALASPFLLSLAGTHLAAFGFPTSAGTVSTGTQRGLASAPQAATAVAGPSTASLRASGPAGTALAGGTRVAGSAAAPAAAPLAAAELVGHAAHHLVRHLSRAQGGAAPRSSELPPVRGKGPG
jgi:hypothetical protein